MVRVSYLHEDAINRMQLQYPQRGRAAITVANLRSGRRSPNESRPDDRPQSAP